MFIAILGRQPAISIAELERVFGSDKVLRASNDAATIDTEQFSIQRLGGSLKGGRILFEVIGTKWPEISKKIIAHLLNELSQAEGKTTLGLSVYGLSVDTRDVQKTGLVLKRKLKESGVSLRLIPNETAALSTASSHHNKLGLSDNKIELLVVKADDNRTIVAISTGSQNISAYAARDQNRPRRDAWVGMLPPKLAQIMVNLAVGQTVLKDRAVLDPFCGTGVVLQEALLLGYRVQGADISDKMVDYSTENLKWLAQKHNVAAWQIAIGDAMTAKWPQPIDAVVSETYLGQPFSAPPSPSKLVEVKKVCNHIVTEFLKNLGGQIKSGTPICIAIPAWRDRDGNVSYLPVVNKLSELGFTAVIFKNISKTDLLYFRENQVVARELLVLTKT